MSNIEKQVGENMVDDMLPPEERPKPKRNAYAHMAGASRRAMEGRIEDDLFNRGYGPDYWAEGGDDISDLSGYPKVSKPFKPRDIPHPKKPSFLRDEYEGPGGWARAKLKRLGQEHPLLSMGQTLTIETVLLESICTTIADEVVDLMEETDLASKGESATKLRAFLRQHILDEYLGWDKMVKKYKPIEEEK